MLPQKVVPAPTLRRFESIPNEVAKCCFACESYTGQGTVSTRLIGQPKSEFPRQRVTTQEVRGR